LKARESLPRHRARARDLPAFHARHGPDIGRGAATPQASGATADPLKGVVPAERTEVCRDFNRAENAGATARAAGNAKVAPMPVAVMHRAKDGRTY